MEDNDLQLIQKHKRQDSHLSGLYEEHVRYEKQLAKLDNKLFLTPEEERLKKELQKKKLKGKDMIEAILRQYRDQSQSQ